MAAKTFFHPYAHGWHFENTNVLNIVDFEYDHEEHYLCTSSGVGISGGMVAEALHNYQHGVLLPNQSHTPVPGSDLRKQLIERQKSFFSANRFWFELETFANRPDQPGIILPHTIGAKTKEYWREKIKPRLNRGFPVPLGVVYPGSKRRVVLAYDYTEDAVTGIVRMEIYHPGFPDYYCYENMGYESSRGEVKNYLEFDLNAPDNQINAKFIYNIHPYPIRGIFYLDKPHYTIAGEISDFSIQSLTHITSERYGTTSFPLRLERFQLTTTMETNIIPYFDVRLDEAEETYIDRIAGKKYGPLVCPDSGNTQIKIINYIHGTNSQFDWDLTFHLTLQDQADSMTVSVPEPQVSCCLFLHSADEPTSLTASSSPIDVRPDDVYLVEENLSEEDIEPYQDRLVNVLVPADPQNNNSVPSVLTGWETSYHLGFINQDIYCQFTPQNMLSPIKITKRLPPPSTFQADIPEEEWERHLIKTGGFQYNHYNNDFHQVYMITAVDASSLYAYNEVHLYAKQPFAFIKPIYSPLENWGDFQSLRDRIHDYIDRDLLKDMINELPGNQLEWVRENDTKVSRTIKKESSRIIDESFLSKNFISQLENYNQFFLCSFIKNPGFWRRPNVRGRIPDTNQDILAEYNKSVLNLTLKQLKQELHQPYHQKSFLSAIKRMVSKSG